MPLSVARIQSRNPPDTRPDDSSPPPHLCNENGSPSTTCRTTRRVLSADIVTRTTKRTRPVTSSDQTSSRGSPPRRPSRWQRGQQRLADWERKHGAPRKSKVQSEHTVPGTAGAGHTACPRQHPDPPSARPTEIRSTETFRGEDTDHHMVSRETRLRVSHETSP